MAGIVFTGSYLNFVITEVHTQASNIGGKHESDTRGQPTCPSTEVRQFKVFSALWGTAALFHMAHSSVFDTQLNLALLTLASFFSILRPSLASFVLLITLQIFDAAFRMPFTTNHWIFTAFANLTILHVLLFKLIREKNFNLDTGKFFKSFAPLVKIEVIILYFFAVFHKLNSGFFTPDTSCATYLLQAQGLDHIIPLTAELYRLNAFFTLAVELSIPVLLCFSRTRNLGVLAGIFFHCILSYSTYNAFYDFSSLMFATYFLFISPAFTEKLFHGFALVRFNVQKLYSGFSMRTLAYSIMTLVLLAAVIFSVNHQLDSPKTVHLYFFWTLYSALFASLFIWYVLTKKPSHFRETVHIAPIHWTLFIIPLLVFINGILPYLGLKTENSYAMFSNLKTEGGATNHFIVPATVQIFDYQKNVVEIISSTDPYLQSLAEERIALVLFEFQNYVHHRQPERVEYRINGERRSFKKDDSATYAALGSNPYILRKLMKFRPFALHGPQPCFH